ncbi:response regulator transcription factor [Caballeronia sp. Lep1P3]|uniref:response regulator transcription factor n=1 Tax=Caballeronia sp. Lep1P3 TaxID=2878150 RepID=UPI001FD427A8|nr:response regulator [Caballeronia sp. Lep1P3]
MSEAKPHVAVVDDDESVCRALARLLRSAGMSALTFGSGDALLAALAKGSQGHDAHDPPPDCIVLDVQMPGINGLEVQRRLSHADVPIVFVTADDDPAMRESAMAGGAAAYLHKPFDDEAFIGAVRAAIQAARARTRRPPPMRDDFDKEHRDD